MTPEGDRAGCELLLVALHAAVPLHIARIRRWTPTQRNAAARHAVGVIAAHGDDLLFSGRHTAAAFNALARALALMADLPGGVTFAGQHWCTRAHAGCPNRPRR
ncbi:hypothetical protein [Phytohabitans rumicis]|uniref:Uncharacterized protein n=1 Tax=Phytohabitans rumicis TaxID=1076125 RepID=A0A6V8LFB7_9ACTN|nr:hypothetical protein [Phytohabitans rumicis]GFJ93309.1 hypothetical protein Prum_069510 [Phytohabitans rumicis]